MKPKNFPEKKRLRKIRALTRLNLSSNNLAISQRSVKTKKHRIDRKINKTS